MAYYVEPAPVLKGQDAKRFLKLMSTSDTRKVDFSREREIARQILQNSDLSFIK